MRTIVTDELISSLKEKKIYFDAKGTYERVKKAKFINYDENIKIGKNAAFLSGNTCFSMGSYSYSWSQLPLDSIVKNYTSIAGGVSVTGREHPINRFTTSSATYDFNFNIFNSENESKFTKVTFPPKKGNVEIGNDVWIGANATLKSGIKIGDGAVVAANSLVTKDVPNYAIVGGNPAVVIRYRFKPNQIDELIKLQWWNYDFHSFEIDADLDIEDFINQFKNLKAENKIKLL